MATRAELEAENWALWGSLEALADLDGMPDEAQAILDEIFPEDEGNGEEPENVDE